jgi:hypothetical protein
VADGGEIVTRMNRGGGVEQDAARENRIPLRSERFRGPDQ